MGERALRSSGNETRVRGDLATGVLALPRKRRQLTEEELEARRKKVHFIFISVIKFRPWGDPNRKRSYLELYFDNVIQADYHYVGYVHIISCVV